jgi:redox-sensitive bicupin YhaK (pirin superfamily)
MSGNIQVIKADARHFSDDGWLKTYWLFSFSDYHDPDNLDFGTLRVFNDDLIAPHSGFPEHPHRDKEIVTVVYRGRLTHRDDQGNEGVVGKGEVQRMSAGAGVMHAEMNEGDEEVHLHQIWLEPRALGERPSYEKGTFSLADHRNALVPVASGREEAVVSMNSDSTIYLAELQSDRMVTLGLGEGRGAFIYLTRGTVAVNGQGIGAFDQARLTHAPYAKIKALKDSTMVIVEVPIDD